MTSALAIPATAVRYVRAADRKIRQLERKVAALTVQLDEALREAKQYRDLYERAAVHTWRHCPYCGRLTQQRACVLHGDLEEIEGRYARTVRRRKETP